MKLLQDIFELEHKIGDQAPLVLRIIGSYTAFKMPSGAWTWDFHYGAYFGDMWLKSCFIEQHEQAEIEAAIDSLITLRVDALDLKEKFSE